VLTDQLINNSLPEQAQPPSPLLSRMENHFTCPRHFCARKERHRCTHIAKSRVLYCSESQRCYPRTKNFIISPAAPSNYNSYWAFHRVKLHDELSNKSNFILN